MIDFFKKNKSSAYSLFLLVFLMAGYYYQSYRRDQVKEQQQKESDGIAHYSGATMGTTYNVKYLAKDTDSSVQRKIDSVLLDVNNSLSTYIPSSEISEFNKNGRVLFRSAHLKTVLNRSKEFHKVTDGMFEPTVMPLVNAYGFGYDKKQLPDSTELKSILQRVDFNLVLWNEDSVWNLKDEVQLDLSAIAKGYGVDEVARLLDDLGVKNYMVEIGGEVNCKGKNNQAELWSIGITDPVNTNELNNIAKLNNESMATSGNYRNFYEEDGALYAHTINPKTGKSEKNALLSATVVAEDCMSADALATACMVMGAEKSIKLAEQYKDQFKFLLIYSDKDEVKEFNTL